MENKTNAGAIFKNDKKTNEKQPDYKGKVSVNGKEMEVALWVKQGKFGSYFSAAFSEPYVAPTEERRPIGDSIDSDFPF
jgi:hypothetical protein